MRIQAINASTLDRELPNASERSYLVMKNKNAYTAYKGTPAFLMIVGNETYTGTKGSGNATVTTALAGRGAQGTTTRKIYNAARGYSATDAPMWLGFWDDEPAAGKFGRVQISGVCDNAVVKDHSVTSITANAGIAGTPATTSSIDHLLLTATITFPAAYGVVVDTAGVTATNSHFYFDVGVLIGPGWSSTHGW